jgi:hypothetical protein
MTSIPLDPTKVRCRLQALAIFSPPYATILYICKYFVGSHTYVVAMALMFD